MKVRAGRESMQGRRNGLPAMLLAASMLAGVGARAQSAACDQLKDVLAARIEATGVRGYSMEVVPGSTAVPPGASVIGTCEGGKYKVLYRRWGAAQPASSPSAAVAQPLPEAKSRRPALVDPADREAPPGPAPAPGAVPTPLATRPDEVASAPAPAAREPAPSGGSGAAMAAPAVDSDAAPAAAPADDAALGQRVSAFMADRWHWLWTLALLPVGAWLWTWHAHRSAYDEAGLPRGPKL